MEDLDKIKVQDEGDVVIDTSMPQFEKERQNIDEKEHLEASQQDEHPVPNQIFSVVKSIASNLLCCSEYIGKKLANFFGITDSRYQWELEEHMREQEEIRKRLLREGEEMKTLEEQK